MNKWGKLIAESVECLKRAASVPPNPEKVALKMVPVILEGENGIMIKASAFRGSSGSSYLKE